MNSNQTEASVRKLIGLCKEQKKTIGSCESLTAGLFCSSIASVPGASAILAGGLVTYMSFEKVRIAHVDPEIIERFGVISSNCAADMAKKSREVLDCDYCVSFTGNAGPDAMENKPAGLCYCAIASRHDLEVFEFSLQENRNDLRMHLVDLMLKNLIDFIQRDRNGQKDCSCSED